MIKRITLTLLLAFLFSYFANAVTFYWKSGLPANSLYTNATNWESAPGSGIPANGAFAPSSIDDVVFPAGNALQSISMGTGAVARNFTILASGKLTFQTGGFTVYGNFASNGNHVFNATASPINFLGSGNHTIDMGDNLSHSSGAAGYFDFNGSGSYNIINNDVNLPNFVFRISNSTFISNGFNITSFAFNVGAGLGSKTVNLANSKLTSTNSAGGTSIGINGSANNTFDFTNAELYLIGATTIGPSLVISAPNNFSLNGLKSINFDGGNLSSSALYIGSNNFIVNIGVTDLNINSSKFTINGNPYSANANLNVTNLNILKPVSINADFGLNLNVNNLNAPSTCVGLSNFSSTSLIPLNINAVAPIVTNSIAFKTINFAGANVSMPTVNNLGQNTGNFTLTGNPASQTFYWVGGTGNWNDPTKWALTSGGTAQTLAGCLPTFNDDVVFDANSFTAANQIVSIAGGGNSVAYCKNILWSAPNLGELQSGVLNISGNSDFSGALGVNSTLNYIGDVGTFTLTSGTNFTYVSNIYFLGTGTYILSDNLSTSLMITISSGNFNTNGKTLSMFKLYSSSLPATAIRNINISNSVVNIVSYLHFQFTGTLNSFNATGSTVNMSGPSAEMYFEYPAASSLNEIVFNDINFTSPTGISAVKNEGFANFRANNISFNSNGRLSQGFSGVNKFEVNSYKFNPGNTYLFSANMNFVVNNAINTSLSSCSPLITLGSSSNGTRFKLNKPAGLFTINGAFVKDINAVGSPLTVIGVDAGNNLNVTVNASAAKDFYWVGGTGSWNTGSNWSVGASGGNPALNNTNNCIPSIQDNVFFDANSFTANGQTVTLNSDVNFKNMLWDAAAGTKAPIFSGAADKQLNVYGSITLATGMTSNITGPVNMLGNDLTQNAQAITTNGVSMRNRFNFTGGGRYDILDELNIIANAYFIFTKGHLYTNGNTIRAGYMSLNVNTGNSADISGSSIYVNYEFAYQSFVASHNSSTNWNAAGSTIYSNFWSVSISNTVPISYGNIVMNPVSSVTAALSGGSAPVTFNNVEWQSNISVMNGDFNINNLTYKTSSNNNVLTVGKTINVANTLIANGTPCNPIVFKSSVGGTPAIINSGACNFDLKFARLTDITAGSCTAAQNKVLGDDVSGNSNWTFTPTINANYLSANIPDLNLKCNQYPYTLTTAGFNTGATSYLWSDGSTGADLVVTGPGTYGVTVTYGAGCDITDNITLGSVPAPVLSPATLSLCETSLGSGTNNFTLTDANATIVATPADYTITYHSTLADATAGTNALSSPYNSATSTIYVRVVEIATGCFSTRAITLTVNDLPIVAAIGNTGTVTVGYTRTLTNATPGGVWSSSNAAVATVSLTGVVTGISAGSSTISYTVTNANTCVTTVSYTINTTLSPIVAVITGTNNACIGKTTQLANATPSGVWATLDATIATVDVNGLVTGVSAGLATISYTVTDVNGTTTVTFDVTINALPVVAAITGTNNACVGKTTQLANATAGGVWTSSDATVATVNATGLVTGIAAGTATISYTVTNASGCITKIDYAITINALPVVAAITGTNNACIGKTTQLANATAGGVWTSSDATVATVNATGLVTGIAAGTATISYTVTNASGCITKVDYAVTINALPVVAAITGTNNACIGKTTQLANATAGGVWTSSDATVATVNATGLVTSVTAGSVTISYTVTNASGCDTKVDYAVTINALPILAAITGTNNACIGKTTQLANATAGGVWTSSDATIATVNASGLVTGVTAGSVTISYTVTNASGCDTKVDYAVTINALPVVAAITGTNNACVGKTTTLANATAGGVWTTSDATIATVDASGVVTGIAAGTATISYTVSNANGCATQIDYAITINPLPVVAAISGISMACLGNTTQLANVTAGGTWSSSDVTIATVNATGLVSGIAVGTATISYTVTNGNGCTTVVTFDVTVSALPTVAAITGTNNACIGKTTALSSTTAGGTWSSSDVTIATVDASGVVSGVAVGTVTISYTVNNGVGCTAKVDYTITINPLPVVAAITGVNNACVGKTTTLANATAGGVWSSSDATIATVDASGVVTGIAAGTATISYTVTNGNGCATQVDYAITINPLPVVAAISGISTACLGKTTQLANVTAGGTWSSSDVTIATVNATGLVSGITVGTATISYTVTNGNGCTTVVTFNVTVSALPTVAAITGTNNACIGKTTTLANATAGGTWSSSDVTIATVDASGVVSGVAVGTVTISYTVNNGVGCTTKVDYAITINPLPVVAAITGVNDACVGKTTTLANATAGGVWSSSDATIATVNISGVVTGIAAGTATISYTVTNGNGCATQVDYAITINPLPVVAAITGINTACLGNTTQLANITAGGVWSSSDVAIATVDATGLVSSLAAGTATISYTVTNGNGCATKADFVVTMGTLAIAGPITGPNSGCVKGNIQLANSTLGGVWSSSDNSIALIDSQGIITGISTGVVTITYTINSSGGCSASETYNITINPIPLVNQIIGDSNSCVSKTIQLSNTTVGGIWSSSNVALATVDGNGLVTNLSSGNVIITYTVTNASGCSTKVDFPITINPLPLLAAINGLAEVCVGNNTKLTNATIGGIWSSSDVTIATVNTEGFVTGIKNGSVTITYTIVGVSGCSGSVNYKVTINPLPTAIISYSLAEYQAVGNANVLQTGQTGGNYTATPLGLSINPTTGAIDLSASTPNQTYTVTYTFSNGNCTSTTNTTIKINSTPAEISFGQAAYCAVGFAKITQKGPTGGTYTSDNAGLKINSKTGEINLTTSSPGVYVVSYTYRDGTIVATTTTTITINALPIVTLTTDLNGYLSKGDVATLTATGGVTYQWIGDDIISGQGTSVVKVRPRIKTTYTVIATNANGCSETITITITVVSDLKLIPNNVVSPNGDGKNDTWVVKNIDYYPENIVTIYDRAGRRIFSERSYQNNWDGTYKGAPLAEGAYVYVIDSGFGIALIRGTLNIIRDHR